MPPPPNPPAPNDTRRPGSKAHLPVAKLLPPLPAGPKPPSRPVPPPGNRAPAPAAPADDPGFEVVEDTAPRRSAHVDTDAGFEVVDDEPAPPRKRKAAVEVDEDDEPRAKKRRKYADEDDADDEPRPKKKKKKKKKRRGEDAVLTEEEEDAERERENAIVDWGVPGFLTLLGFAFALIGAMKTAGLAGGFGAILVILLGIIVIVPVSIGALMVIGMLVGIEYGTPMNAIRNLTAITTFIFGLMILGIGLGFCGIVYILSPLLMFGMLMALFRLDTWETWITVTILDGMLTVSSWVLVIVIVSGLMIAADKSMKDPDAGGGGWNQPKNNDWQGGGQPKWGGPDDDDN